MADTFEEDLLAALCEPSPLTSEIGERSYWGQRPRGGRLSAVTLQEAAEGRVYSHNGAVSLQGPRIQFDIWGATQLDCLRVKRNLVTRLEALPGTTIGGTKFTGCFLVMSRDWDPERPGEGDPVHRHTIHFTIFHVPAA